MNVKIGVVYQWLAILKVYRRLTIRGLHAKKVRVILIARLGEKTPRK